MPAIWTRFYSASGEGPDLDVKMQCERESSRRWQLWESRRVIVLGIEQNLQPPDLSNLLECPCPPLLPLDSLFVRQPAPERVSTQRAPDPTISTVPYLIIMKFFTASSIPIIAVIGASLSTLIAPVQGGLLAYGICQAGCSALVVSYYAAAGAVFGTVTAGVGTPAVILGCNASYGTCQAACAVAFLAPIP